MLRPAERYLTGAVAGLIATVPMTALMLFGQRRLRWRSQDPLPPLQITRRALRTVDGHDNLSPAGETFATAISHFAYGAAAGSLYGRLLTPGSAAGCLITGTAYGLAVWSGSYLAWLPATGLYRSATEETPERNGLMVASHIVWGASLGLLTYALSKGPSAAAKQREPEKLRDSRIADSQVANKASA